MMNKLIITVAAFLAFFQVTHGGYIQGQGGYYYPSGIQTVVGQSAIPASYYRPAFGSYFQVPQKQPLQLRPPQSAVPVALPNSGPPVTIVHAARPQQQAVYPSSPVPAYPSVVAVQAQQPVVAAQVVRVPNYSFGYAVKDAVTGDEKSHEESRTGDNVVGKYTVVEPDGTLRTVTYTAGVHGFNAIVSRTPGYAPPNAPAKVIAISKPVAIARPVAIPISAPAVAISRPVAVSSPFGGPLIQPPVGVSYPSGFHFGG